MKNMLFAVLAVLVIWAGGQAVMAVPAGKKLVFDGGNMGRVTFSGKIHAEAGNKCKACHTDIFEMKHGTAEITYADHKKGEAYCFACHNGTVAHEPTGNCKKCHKKE